MKKVFLVLATCGLTSLWAQTTSNPSGMAITPPASAVLSPTLPSVTVDTLPPITSPVLPDFTNAPSDDTLTTTNGTGTSLPTDDLSTLLVDLENVLAQTLPALAAFNDSFDLSSLDTGSLSSGVPNSATNLANSFGQNLATSFASNLATPTAGLPGATSSVTNVLFVNSLNSFPVTRDTFEALLILQNDIQRLLPLVNALNGGTNF